MKRLTTDNPKTNYETLLNYAYAKDNEVYLRYGNGSSDIKLTEYIAGEACCEVTPEEIMDGHCHECDCIVAILNAVATQAAELRARLKAYEDTGYDPTDIADLAAGKATAETIVHQNEEWEKNGTIIRLPCKVGDTVYAIEPNLCDLRDKDTCNVYCDGWDFSCPDFHSDSTIRQRHFQLDDLRRFGETVFRSHEEAVAALGGAEDDKT